MEDVSTHRIPESPEVIEAITSGLTSSYELLCERTEEAREVTSANVNVFMDRVGEVFPLGPVTWFRVCRLLALWIGRKMELPEEGLPSEEYSVGIVSYEEDEPLLHEVVAAEFLAASFCAETEDLAEAIFTEFVLAQSDDMIEIRNFLVELLQIHHRGGVVVLPMEEED